MDIDFAGERRALAGTHTICWAQIPAEFVHETPDSRPEAVPAHRVNLLCLKKE
jgi:hypothetical protein